jgi:hypothetical protein
MSGGLRWSNVVFFAFHLAWFRPLQFCPHSAKRKATWNVTEHFSGGLNIGTRLANMKLRPHSQGISVQLEVCGFLVGR